MELSFRRGLMVAKSECWFHHVRLSVSAPLTLCGFPWDFVLVTYENLSRKSDFGYNRTKMSANLHDDPSAFMLAATYVTQQ